MTVLRESPWYQEILREGENRGVKQGLGQGLERERSLIIRQLSRKLGSLPPEMVDRVQSLSFEPIERLGEALFDFEQPEDLQTWLDQH